MTSTTVDSVVAVLLRRPLSIAVALATTIVAVAVLAIASHGLDWRSAVNVGGTLGFGLLTALSLTVSALTRRRHPSRVEELPSVDQIRLDEASTANRKGRPVLLPARLVPALRHELDRERVGRTGGVELLGTTLFGAALLARSDLVGWFFGGAVTIAAVARAVGVVVNRPREPDLRIQPESEVRS